ncbi:zinc finger CCCH domain-containing protein 13 [Biomphalaria pfeifferi]|uniref:Zinc finger CCCH domain-containing protein 13 n=1 Tax=Biomphalaria pfeifferi TaxID=112525 RepID=A0AAD8EWW3_BIOPF|nr:zinc finger CCCH domain-containing protein 13 [Biomphalaria pfeifferi]
MDTSRSKVTSSVVKLNEHADKEKLTRADSNLTKLCDLHVYKVPSELWRENFNNILNNVVTETVSVGIIRVPLQLRLAEIREEMVSQLQLDDLLPRDYVFLRSVGRSLTRLLTKQEYQLKAKHFVPPVAYAPELYILETTPEMREAMASDRSSQSPPTSRRTSPSHRNYNGTYRINYPGDSDNERSNKPKYQPSSPVQKYHPLPKIGPEKNRHHDPMSPEPKNYSTDDSPFSRHNGHHNPYQLHNGKPASQPKVYHEQPSSDWDDQPVKKMVIDSEKSGHSGHPSETKRGSDEQDDNDSIVTDDDDYKKRSREDHDYKLRKTQDLQRKLDDDKYLFDDETEEERRRRLEDLELGFDNDRQRWQADKDSRKRQALADKRREEDERHHRELENRRRDEFERQQLEESERKRLEEERREREELERRRMEEQAEEETRWMEEEEQRRREEADRRRKEEEKRRKEEEKEKEEEKLRKEAEKRKDEEKKKAEERKREEERRKEEEKKKEEERRREEERIKESKRVEEEKRIEEERRELKRRQDQEEWDKKFREEHAMQEKENQRSKETSPPPVRDSESAKQRRRNEKNQLLKDIEDARQARQDQEKEREDLVKRAKQMQHKTTNRRNEARDMWKKKYFEEKKKTAPLEENSNRLQQELEALHKKLMNTLEGPKEKNAKFIDAQPSPKSNYIIQCTKIQHEIEDLQRRVENARMKLTAEMKLRNQAQGELRALRAELNQRKLSMEKTRQQQLAALNPSLLDINSSHPRYISDPKSDYSKTSLEGF